MPSEEPKEARKGIFIFIASGYPLAMNIVVLIDYYRLEIFFEQLFGTLKLLLGVFLHGFELVFPAHGFPLVNAEAVVREYLDALYLLVLTESFAEGADIFFHIAIAGHEDVAKPEGVIVLFEPSCGAQGSARCCGQ